MPVVASIGSSSGAGGCRATYCPVPVGLVAGGVPPTLVAAESVPSMLLGVLVVVLLAFWPPHAPSKVPPTSSVANAT